MMSCAGPKRDGSGPSLEFQPMDCRDSIGSQAKFSVSANGTRPINYQWYMNDTPVQGATQAEFTIDRLEVVHHLAKVWVQVSNSFGTLDSKKATIYLMDAPASPKSGDLRFKRLNAYPSGLVAGNLETFLSAAEDKPTSSLALNGRLGTPLPIACGTNLDSESVRFAWPYYAPALPASPQKLNTSYFSGEYSKFEAYLQARLEDVNSLITSMECVKNGCFAFSTLQSPDAKKFKANYQVVEAEAFAKHVQTEAQDGRVVTAFAYKEGQIHCVAYGWDFDLRQHDVIVSDPLGRNALISKIKELAKDGYIITALGGDAKSRYQVVGTRIEDLSLPRPTEIVNSAEELKALLLRGYTVMAALAGAPDEEPVWICQQ